MSDSYGSLLVQIADIVRDARLQCRVEVQQETVRAYAELLKDGTELPPVSLLRVDEQLLLVDGWHRVAAAQAAGRRSTATCRRAGASSASTSGRSATRGGVGRRRRLPRSRPSACGTSS